MHVPIPSVNIGFENDNGAAGVLEIGFRYPLTPAQVYELVSISRNHILDTFQQTQTVPTDQIINAFHTRYMAEKISLDQNIADLTANDLNELFQQWFHDSVDLVFTISDHSVSLSSEGSNDQLVHLFQSYGLCME